MKIEWRGNNKTSKRERRAIKEKEREKDGGERKRERTEKERGRERRKREIVAGETRKKI